MTPRGTKRATTGMRTLWAFTLLLAACTPSASVDIGDSHQDAGPSLRADTGSAEGRDASTSAGLDAGTQVGADAGDPAGADGGNPAGPDAGSAPNRDPTAHAGLARNVVTGNLVSLDGSGSSDPDGDLLTFAWSFESQPEGSSATLSNPSSVSASFTPDEAGSYVLRLAVSDGRGGTDSTTVTITAAAPGRPLPSAFAGPNQTVTVGAPVQLAGTERHNPGAGALTHSWTLRSRPAGSSAALSSGTSDRPTFVADTSGIYVIDLVVASGALASAPDTVLVTAEPAGNPPVNPTAPADIVVTDQVIQPNVEGIGMNLTKIAGGTNFATNNFFYGTGFEPLVYRKLIRLDRAGVDERGQWMEWDGGGGVNVWETLGTGFGNGATVRFYRMVDSAGEPLAYQDGLTDASGADHVVFLGAGVVPGPTASLAEGGWMPGGQQRVYVDRSLNLRRGDYLFLVLKRTSVPREQMHSRVQQYYRGNFSTLFVDDAEATLVPHPGTLPASFTMRGETCLRLERTTAGTARAGQWLFHPYDTGEGQWYSQLHPGATYRISAWLRQEGLPQGGRVRAVFAGNGAYTVLSQSEPWNVTGEWQHFTYDFTAPAYPTSGSHSGVGIEFTGPGALFVDNLSIHKHDEKHGFAPNGPHELSLDEWMASVPSTGPKPAVRFYPLSYGTSAVENLLGNVDGNPTYSVNDGAFSAASGVTLPAIMKWALATGDAPGNRVVPFLTFTEKYTEREWLAVMEYLGVPYDAGSDTPEAKPWAFMRFQQRGTGTPWTDEFREIVVEYGNETWHNGAGGYGWDGFSSAGAVHQGGKEYGLFARYMFQNQVMTAPFWSQYQLGDKIKLALGANYDARLEWGGSYGAAAVQQNRVTDYLGHANYVGPKWETNDPGRLVFDAHGLQVTLIALHTDMRPLIRDAAEVRRRLNGTTGTRYRLEAYEGGPSGYWTPNGSAEVDEQYGKSLAMGVAALDAWLFSSQNGYVHQCYLGFGSGTWWTSHTLPEAGGFRAHPGWLALRMRNVYARGREMVAVTFNDVPRYNRTSGGNTEAVPLISSYAFQDGAATYVFVLSRKYPGNHDGVDFGAGFTPVTLRLPFSATPRRIQLHKLARSDGSAADPGDNNRTAETVFIHSSEIPTASFQQAFPISAQTGGTDEGMPPGTAFLYVFER